ncbi:uncharacterized protein C8Q71DRAFT_789897 [Rhodofomes roseus]|uniref:BTB domain-containing protein n=1 Tax=Rhodofomes roseus TaxID=34475 RepID=A0ABQ8JZ37_9APHY|nr:uncharacterized protein C8Q71DRAFT_789897 [Rhodofomes roseus]KAH9829568.1 hypothetical protein C8Q71DRAFT_789897 [Rhodofomes roseus]
MTTHPRSQSPDEPLRKRLRTGSPPSEPAPAEPKEAFSRDGIFWLDDGNVILLAQGVGFRVYKGWLSSQSEVFRDMFNLAKPAPGLSQESEVVDGCPVVHVTDTAAEVRSLLGVLFSGRQYICRLKLKLNDITNCVRMAHKYGIQDLLDDFLEELKSYFPDNFDAWENRLSCDQAADAITVVNIARLTDTPSILPAALYSCCLLDGEELLQGRVCDGVTESLSSEDLARCIDGKAKLCTRQMRACFEIFPRFFKNTHCKMSDKQCTKTVAHIHVEQMVDDLRCGDADIFDPWDQFIEAYDPEKKPDTDWKLCSSCVSALCKKEKSVRKRMWSELPQLLCLDEDSADEDNAEEGNEDEGDAEKGSQVEAD